MGSSGARVALRSVYLEGDFASIRRKIAIDLFVSGVKTPAVRCCVFYLNAVDCLKRSGAAA